MRRSGAVTCLLPGARPWCWGLRLARSRDTPRSLCLEVARREGDAGLGEQGGAERLEVEGSCVAESNMQYAVPAGSAAEGRELHQGGAQKVCRPGLESRCATVVAETNAVAAVLGSGAGGTSLHQPPSAHVVALTSSLQIGQLCQPHCCLWRHTAFCLWEPTMPTRPYFRKLFMLKMQQMENAFFQQRGRTSWGDNVIFKPSYFTSAADLSRTLRLHDPAVLHFSGHGHTSTLSLFGQDLAAQDLVKFIESWCASVKRLQFIIANACHSAEIVHALSEHVDFVIEHSTHVLDADAVNFARELYGHLVIPWS